MSNMMIAVTAALLLAGVAWAQAVPQEPDEQFPTLTVSGRGQVSAAPDEAVLRLGATAQAEEAATAQDQVNQVMQDAISALRELGVPADRIQTVDLSLSPVYSERRPGPMPGPRQMPDEPRIVGYRASNVVQVRLEDLTHVGPVVDAAVGAGANELQQLSFQLQDDLEARQEALRRAVREARAKAEAIAQAMDVRLQAVQDVTEGGYQVYRPQYARQAMMAESAAPVQPGQVQVEASVTVRYRLARVNVGGGEAQTQPADNDD